MVTKHRTGGFTLIEVVCAFAVLTVLGFGLVHGGQNHARNIRDAFERTVAVRVAQSELERLRAMDPGDLVLGKVEFDTGRVDGLEGVRGTITIVPEGSPRDRLLAIEVVVEWLPAGAERARRIALSTLRAQEAKR